MTDLINIGSSGIRAYAQALATVSDNIANSQTAGYARRSVSLTESAPSGDAVLYRNNIRPGGVLVTGIERAVNEWLVEDSRTASSDAGQASARASWLSAAESALDDGAGGIGAAVTSVFNIADQLASDPASQSQRAAFLNAVDNAAGAFRNAATNLASVSSSMQQEAETATAQLNSDLEALARVNDGLRSARDGSVNQASLLDDRDRLLDEISNTLAVKVDYDAHGAVSLRTAGSIPENLIQGTNISLLSVTADAMGQLSFALSGGASLTPISGQLAGLSLASGQVAGQRANIDSLAAQFANDLNSWHQAGLDGNGTAGQPLLAIGAGALSLTALTLTTNNVAAASASDANGNMLSIANLRGSGGVEAGWSAFSAAQAQSTANALAQEAATGKRYEGAKEARQEVSAVDLDTEAAELLRFQQAYQGAARVIQVARENMQTIFNIF